MIGGKTLASDAYPAIDYLVRQMGERHSFLRPAHVVELLRTGKPSDNGQTIGETTLPLAGRYPGDIIAINVPGHTGSIDSDRSYATTLRRVLAKAQQIGICRVLIDLRANDGGNMWPMLNGLAPLLGREPYGYFLSTDGKETAWKVSSGTTTVTDGVNPPDMQETKALGVFPVAVLIGRGTQSSGEFTAMAFRGRPNTMFFGAPTGGFVTANGSYELPDGAQLFVAQSWASDRIHRPYKVAVVPNENTDDRQTFDAGLTWLRNQKCAPKTSRRQ
jgi:carboxyl-terminal processing protease